MPSRAMLLPLVLLLGCRSNSGDHSPSPSNSAEQPAGPDWFTDVAEQAGVHVVHFNGMTGKFYYPEIVGSGVALFDYDNDGDLDLYLVQGRMLRVGDTVTDALFPPDDRLPPNDRLYRNDLEVRPDGLRTLRFTDVTDTSGISARGYGMGVAAGDIDNDGWIDLYLTKFGQNQMLRNNGDGTFIDVSRQSGTENNGAWSVSASFLDFDRDGWLDLYVGNYLNYSISTHVNCFGMAGKPDYCSPSTYRAQPDRLYRNRRDGTFVDVTAVAGVAREFGPALGVSTADFNADGWTDIYVANDGQANQLWMNQGDGTFRNTAFLSGAALNADGKAEASMGVDAADFDADGDEDLFITNLTGEGSTLYVNDGSAMFEDAGTASGLRPSSLSYTGFGTAWLDFDNDGWLDLLTVNGEVRTVEPRAQANDPFPFDQRRQLFRNLGNGRFDEVTGNAGAVFEVSEVGRGAGFGDIDNDGDVDVVVSNNSGPVRLLLNNIGNRKHWLGLRLVGRQAPRDMLGARVRILRKAGPPLWRRARTDGSYASANDPRVLVGLGDSTELSGVRVIWPSGRVEDWTHVPIDRWTTLEEGRGK